MSKGLRVITNHPTGQTSSIDGPAYVRIGERVRRLQAEAEQLAREHIGVFTANLLQAQRLAEEIAVGGEAYPPGVREIARRMAEENQVKLQALEAIMARR
ncbi:MAG TPA: hypothetical protein VGM25_00500 [Caulobacteraceae bacterium]|jgi:hypothetical protein